MSQNLLSVLEYIEYKHYSTQRLFKNQRAEQSLKPGGVPWERAQGYAIITTLSLHTSIYSSKCPSRLVSLDSRGIPLFIWVRAVLAQNKAQNLPFWSEYPAFPMCCELSVGCNHSFGEVLSLCYFSTSSEEAILRKTFYSKVKAVSSAPLCSC